MTAKTDTIRTSKLPAIGAPLLNGTFCGITTLKDGTHIAVIYLGASEELRNWRGCVDWANSVGGQLPTRSILNMMRATVKNILPKSGWCFTADLLSEDTGDESDSKYAWSCDFDGGTQSYGYHKTCEGLAVAVRAIHLKA